MNSQNSAPTDPLDQNSAQVIVEHQVRPDDLMAELGIKKDAYYSYLKHLDIKAQKDGSGKAYLTLQQADRIRALRSHVVATGSREGFKYGGGLSVVGETNLGDVAAAGPTPEYEAATGSQLDDMVRQAQQLAAYNLVMGNRVVAEMSRQIGYDDLPEDLKQQVDHARAATVPKANPAEVASSLLNRWRVTQGSGHPSGAIV